MVFYKNVLLAVALTTTAFSANLMADHHCEDKYTEKELLCHIKHELHEQGEAAEKCCKKIRHELDEIEDLILSQTDQLAVCCSVIEGDLGDLCASSVVDITGTILGLPISASIVDFLDSSCFDVATMLKSILAVVTQVASCTCD